MPENIILYLLLLAALATGFLLGRRELKRRRQGPGFVPQDYFKGLNHLLNDRHDLAIDTFVETMPVDNHTVATHLALGALVRRRGEVDQAIRIHQNLLSCSVLSTAQHQQTRIELARDFLVAGLLDRAENLLLEMDDGPGEYQQTVQELLLEIYQQEKEWSRAVSVGRKLAKQDRTVRARVAHFECELAQQHIAAGEPEAARAALTQAARMDPDCARVPLTIAELEASLQRHKEACKALRKACRLDPELIAQVLPDYRQACLALDREAQYREFLQQCLSQTPSLPVVEQLARYIEHEQGVQAALDFTLDSLTRHPSAAGFAVLLEQLQRLEQPLQPGQLLPVLQFTRALLERQSLYRCKNCGFGARSLMWQCPSCRSWGCLKPTSSQDLA